MATSLDERPTLWKNMTMAARSSASASTPVTPSSLGLLLNSQQVESKPSSGALEKSLEGLGTLVLVREHSVVCKHAPM